MKPQNMTKRSVWTLAITTAWTKLRFKIYKLGNFCTSFQSLLQARLTVFALLTWWSQVLAPWLPHWALRISEVCDRRSSGSPFSSSCHQLRLLGPRGRFTGASSWSKPRRSRKHAARETVSWILAWESWTWKKFQLSRSPSCRRWVRIQAEESLQLTAANPSQPLWFLPQTAVESLSDNRSKCT